MTIDPSNAATASPSASKRASILAALGLCSALLSTFAGVNLGTRLAGWPFLPGVYFGAALAIGAYLWVTKSPLRLLAIVVGILVAWYLGFQTAIGVNLSLRELMKPYENQNAFWITAFTGICGGFVGALLTAATIALVSNGFRSVGDWARTIAAGAAAGVLLIFFSEASRWPHTGLPEYLHFLPLFVVWQPAVAAMVGLGLGRRES